MKDIQNNEKIQKSAGYLLVEWAWIASFAIGSIMLALAIIGVPFQDGTQSTVGVITFVIPAYFGPPATLLSVIQALVFRLYRSPISVIVLPVYFLIIGCTLLIILAVSGMALLLGGSPLALILWIPLFIGVPATVLSIKSVFAHRPSRLHTSVMLLLAHILVFALHFVIGAIACC